MLGQIKSQAEATALGASLAKPRFEPYRSTFEGAILDAARLYILDAELRGALLELLHFAEVSLRERMHRRLSAMYGPWWFNGQRVVLDDRTRSRFREAESKVSPGSKTPDRVIAAVSLGGWTDLLEVGGTSDGGYGALPGRADYETTLWDAGLAAEFSALGSTRQHVAAHLRRVRRLRNRVAHHETIAFGIHQPGEKDSSGKYRRQDPSSAVGDVRKLLEHFCPHMHNWLAACDHAELLLAEPGAQSALLYAKAKRKDIVWI